MRASDPQFIDRPANSYTAGETFAPALHLTVARPERSVPDRPSLLVDLAKGRDVLHVGCCDHLPLIAAKVAGGTWLHGRLCGVARTCLGIDIDRPALERVKELGFPATYCDVTAELPDEVRRSWHLLILGEILEHTDNPVDFLAAIRRRFHGLAEEIVITVPNASASINWKYIRRGIERVNSDHRYYFTPYTLAKVCSRAGLAPSWFRYVAMQPVGWWRGRRLRRYPGLRDGIVMAARI